MITLCSIYILQSLPFVLFAENLLLKWFVIKYNLMELMQKNVHFTHFFPRGKKEAFKKYLWHGMRVLLNFSDTSYRTWKLTNSSSSRRVASFWIVGYLQTRSYALRLSVLAGLLLMSLCLCCCCSSLWLISLWSIKVSSLYFSNMRCLRLCFNKLHQDSKAL